jgi:hypothetical protein
MAHPLGPSGPRRTGDGPNVPPEGRHGPLSPEPRPKGHEAPRPDRAAGAPKTAEAGRHRRAEDAAPSGWHDTDRHPDHTARRHPDPGGSLPHGGPPFALGLMVPAQGVSAAHPRAHRPLPGLPRPYRPGAKPPLRQRFAAWLNTWLMSPAQEQAQARSHAAPPVALLAWRRPQGSALLTVPLPDRAALEAVGVRARPQWPEPSPAAVAVVVKAREPERAPATVAAPVLAAAPVASEPSLAGLPTTASRRPAAAPLTSLNTPRAPTALVLGLAAPRRPAGLPKAKAARPKKKARQWATGGAAATSSEGDETVQPNEEPESQGRDRGRPSS